VCSNPGNTGCVEATFIKKTKTLHLETNCPTTTNAVPTPTGTIQFVSVLIDVQGTADLTKVMVNGKVQKLAPGKADFARPCKKGGWKTFTSPTFKNQGQCVKFLVHGRNAAKKSV
jgi:hypothetical protein